jgi:hypothetical protein
VRIVPPAGAELRAVAGGNCSTAADKEVLYLVVCAGRVQLSVEQRESRRRDLVDVVVRPAARATAYRVCGPFTSRAAK